MVISKEQVDGDACGYADWKASPHEVLEEVDDLLKEHGLEIVLVDDDSDTHCFYVRKRR